MAKDTISSLRTLAARKLVGLSKQHVEQEAGEDVRNIVAEQVPTGGSPHLQRFRTEALNQHRNSLDGYREGEFNAAQRELERRNSPTTGKKSNFNLR